MQETTSKVANEVTRNSWKLMQTSSTKGCGVNYWKPLQDYTYSFFRVKLGRLLTRKIPARACRGHLSVQGTSKSAGQCFNNLYSHHPPVQKEVPSMCVSIYCNFHGTVIKHYTCIGLTVETKYRRDCLAMASSTLFSSTTLQTWAGACLYLLLCARKEWNLLFLGLTLEMLFF